MATSIKISQLPELTTPTSASFTVMIDSGITHYITAGTLKNTFTANLATTNSVNIVSASAWGAFQSASSYSSSFANKITTLATTGSNTFNGAQIVSGALTTTGLLSVTANGAHEGGQINLATAPLGTLTGSSVNIDIYDNKIRFFEGGGNNRGGYFDLTQLASVAGTNLLAVGYATTGSNTFKGTQTISGSLFISGTTELGGNIIPKTARGATLGTSDRPFSDIFVSSGSINIASDTPGAPNTTLSNVGGNILVSAGGMRLVGNASFIAATGSFQYISGSMEQIGNYTQTGNYTMTGNKIITGSLYVSGTIVDTDRMVIGDVKGDDNNIIVAGTEYNSQLVVSNYGSDYVGQLMLHRHSTEIQPILVSARSNSDDDTDTDVTPGMALLQIAATGWAGTDYKEFANIVFSADDADGITIGDGSSPGKIDFNVSPNGDVHTNNALTLRSNLNAEFNGLIKANGIVLGANYPTTSKGQAGDLNGMISSDGNYIYYCFEDYISGTNNIWKRVQLSNSTW